MSERLLRIIIAEDNAADVMLVREALDAHEIRFEMTHVKDGAEALAMLCDNPELLVPDLILLDLNMPKVGGLEVLAAIQNNGTLAAVPVIVLTSSPAPQEQEIARKYGVIHYLRKPSDLYEFIEQVGGVIKNVIGSREA